MRLDTTSTIKDLVHSPTCYNPTLELRKIPKNDLLQFHFGVQNQTYFIPLRIKTRAMQTQGLQLCPLKAVVPASQAYVPTKIDARTRKPYLLFIEARVLNEKNKQ